MIEIRNLSKTYTVNGTKRTVLTDVALTFPDRGLVAIDGPSGAGKTTLVSIIGGLLTPDRQSTVLIDGEKVDYEDAKKLEALRNSKISFVFQQYNFLGSLSLLENLLLTGADKASALKMLSRVGLSDRLGNEVKELSGGEIKRLALARAFLSRSDIVIVDEPTAGLDGESAVEIIDLLKELAAESLVIAVSHDVEYLLQECSGIIEIRNGTVVKDTVKDMKMTEVTERSSRPKVLTAHSSRAIRKGLFKANRFRVLLISFFSAVCFSMLFASLCFHPNLTKLSYETLSATGETYFNIADRFGGLGPNLVSSVQKYNSDLDLNYIVSVYLDEGGNKSPAQLFLVPDEDWTNGVYNCRGRLVDLSLAKSSGKIAVSSTVYDRYADDEGRVAIDYGGSRKLSNREELVMAQYAVMAPELKGDEILMSQTAFKESVSVFGQGVSISGISFFVSGTSDDTLVWMRPLSAAIDYVGIKYANPTLQTFLDEDGYFSKEYKLDRNAMIMDIGAAANYGIGETFYNMVVKGDVFSRIFNRNSFDFTSFTPGGLYNIVGFSETGYGNTVYVSDELMAALLMDPKILCDRLAAPVLSDYETFSYFYDHYSIEENHFKNLHSKWDNILTYQNIMVAFGAVMGLAGLLFGVLVLHSIVRERQYDIALLKSFGLKDRRIFACYIPLPLSVLACIIVISLGIGPVISVCLNEVMKAVFSSLFEAQSYLTVSVMPFAAVTGLGLIPLAAAMITVAVMSRHRDIAILIKES